MEKKCTVRDGRFVVPCGPLNRLVGRAVEHVHLFDIVKREPSRSYVKIKSGDWTKQGLVVNFCPCCGTQIDAPVHALAENA